MKKLELKKSTIANLNEKDLMNVRGGVNSFYPTETANTICVESRPANTCLPATIGEVCGESVFFC